MKKILFCSNTFLKSNHGPAKFAKFVLKINAISDKYEIRVLTESVDKKFDLVYPLQLYWAKIFKPFSMIFRMFDYYRGARSLKKIYDFDILVFNHSFIGLWSKMMFGNRVTIIGMINDENSLSFSGINWQLSGYDLRHIIFRWFERKAANRLDYIIANSKYVRDLIIKQYGVDASKVGLVYKGVDLTKFPSFLSKKIDTGKVIDVMFVKSDAKVGGLSYLIEALSELKEYQFCLKIIGNHDFNQSFVNNPGLQIKYMGLLTEDEIFQLMKNETDIFCVPSIKEGLGVANMEAALHSIPIISTNVGGIPEVVQHGLTAILVSPKDVEALKNGFKSVLINMDQTENRKFEAYKYVKNHFDIKNSLVAFTKCIDAAIATKNEGQ